MAVSLDRSRLRCAHPHILRQGLWHYLRHRVPSPKRASNSSGHVRMSYRGRGDKYPAVTATCAGSLTPPRGRLYPQSVTTNRSSALFRTLLVVLVAFAQAVCVCGHAAASTEQSQHEHHSAGHHSAGHSCCDEHGTSHEHSDHQSHPDGGHADGCQHCVGASFVKPSAVDLATPGASPIPDRFLTAMLVESFASQLHATYVAPPPFTDRPPPYVLFRRTVILVL